MKKFLWLIATLGATFVISGCGGGGGVSEAAKNYDITKSNAKEVTQKGLESLEVISISNDLEGEVADIVKDLIRSKREIATVENKNVTYNCDEGSLTLNYKDSGSQKSAILTANRCLDNGDYYDGVVEVKTTSYNDNNKTQEQEFTFNKFKYKSGDDEIYWEWGKVYNKSIEVQEGIEPDDTVRVTINKNLELNGYVKDQEDTVSFENFKADYELKNDNYKYFAINGKVKFSEFAKWIELKTLTPIKKRNKTQDCPVAGEVKVIGKSSYLLIEYKNDGTLVIYYNGKDKICEKNCKDCF